MSFLKTLGLVVVAVFALVSLVSVLLHPSEPKTPPPRPTAKSEPLPVEPGFAEYLVDLIDSAQKTRDWSRFDAACDLEEFARRIIGSMNLSEPMRDLVRTLVGGDTFLGPRNALRDYFANSQAVCLRIRTVDGEPRPLYRLITPQGSVSFIECIVSTRKGGPGRRLVDLHLFAAGRHASAYMAETLLPAPESLAVLNSLQAPTPMDVVFTRPERARYVELIQSRKASEAERWFKQHQDLLSKDRSAMLLRLQWTSLATFDGAYDALKDFERAFPGDPVLVFNRFAGLRASRRYEEALKAVDVMEREIEGDPYFDLLRATLHSDAGRIAEALECARRCTESDPSLTEAWYLRIELSFRKQNWEETTQLLEAADRSVDIDLQRLAALQGYTAFSATGDFLSWAAKRRGTQK
jgi:hypothetical protein